MARVQCSNFCGIWEEQYAPTINFYLDQAELVYMGCLGRTICTIHLIFGNTSQEGIERNKANK